MNEEVFFNELSLNDKPNDYSVLENLRDSYLSLKKSGFTVCRVDKDIRAKISDYLISINGVSQKTVNNFFFSFFHTPYEGESIQDEEIEKYCCTKLFYDNIEVEGFKWALIYNTLAFSLLTHENWKASVVQVKNVVTDEFIDIHHVATEESVISNQEWIDTQQPVELSKTNLDISSKEFHVSPHHGIHELKEFWKVIRNCVYVEACINSIDHESKSKELINKVNPDGTIELVLHWTEKGYGMVIKTTGKNIRETKEIAKIICDRYDK